MTKMEKLALVVTLLECVVLGYFKYETAKVITKKFETYFEEEAKQQIARQRQKMDCK